MTKPRCLCCFTTVRSVRDPGIVNAGVGSEFGRNSVSVLAILGLSLQVVIH